VGTVLTLTDLITPKLLELSKSLLKVELQVAGLDRQFKQIGKSNGGIKQASNYTAALDKAVLKTDQHAKLLVKTFGKLSTFDGKAAAGAGALLTELDKSDGAAGRLTGHLAKIVAFNPEMRALAESTKALSNALRSSSTNAALLAHQVKSIHALGALPSIPVHPGGSIMPGAGGRGGGGGRRGTHAGLHGGGAHIGPGGIGMSGVGLGFGAGALVPMAAGYGAYALGSASVKEAAEYQREQLQFSMFGMNASQNAEAKRFSERTQMPGASLIDKMRYMTESQGVFRESGISGDEALSGAKLVAPILAKLHFASLASGHEMDETEEKSMLRFVETRGGLKDPKELARIADLGFKVTMTSGGNVDWEQMRQAMTTGGIAAKGLSDEAMFAWGEPLIGELKGGRFGTGLRTAYSRMNGLVKLPNQSYHEMERLGLWDKNMVVENSNGGIKSFKGNPLLNSDEYAKNPFKYYVDHIKPKYDKLGLTDAQRNTENAMIFGNTGSMLFSTLEQQLPTILRSLPALNQAKGLDAATSSTGESVTGQMKNFDAAWSDFKVVFGTSALPAVTEMLKEGTTLLKNLSGFQVSTDAGNSAVSGQHTVFGKIKAAWDWANGNLPNPQGARDATVASPGSGSMNVTVHAVMDGTPIHTKVVESIVRKTATSLGTGFFDPNASPRNQFTTGH
jgi:hypothetical protein